MVERRSIHKLVGTLLPPEEVGEGMYLKSVLTVSASGLPSTMRVVVQCDLATVAYWTYHSERLRRYLGLQPQDIVQFVTD